MLKVSFYPVKAPRYDAALVSENKTLGKLETETCGKTETQILIEGKYKHKKYQAKQSNSPQGLITSLYDQSFNLDRNKNKNFGKISQNVGMVAKYEAALRFFFSRRI